MSDERYAWDRRPEESALHYNRFRAYRDLGPARTYGVAAEALGLSEKRVKVIARRWDWPARAVAWDDHCNRVEDEARVDAIREMYRDHRIGGHLAFELATKAIAMIDPATLSAADAARLLDLGARLEATGATAEVERDELAAAADPWEAIARELAAGR